MNNNSFKQTDIGPIPVDWEVDELENFIDRPQYGYTASSSKNGNSLFLRITDITDLGVNWGSVPFCSIDPDDLEKYLLNDNDIVFARIGATTGKSYLIKNPPSSIFASYLIRVRTKESLYAPFLFFFFNSTEYWRQINSNKGRNLKGGVNASLLSKLITPFPPLQEQRKIAHILTKIQQAIEKQEQIIKTTQELKKALMQKLFTEGINNEPQKRTDIGLIPQSWEVIAINDCVKETQTRNPSKLPDKYIKYVDVSSVSNQSFSVIDHQYVKGVEAPGRARKVIKTNDVIFATIRPTLKRITKINLLFNDEYCSTAFCVLRCKSDILDSDFLFQYVQTDSFIERIGKLQSGASYPAVRDDNVKEMLIPFPHFNEQKKISEVLTSLDTKIEFHNKNKIQLQDLFKTMLNQLMSGQLRVKDIDLSTVADLKVPSREGI